MLEIFLFFILLPFSAQALDCAQTPADLQVYEQTKAVNCQLKEIAQKINEKKNVVPKYLYHFGKKEFLDQDIKAQTIPLEAWNNSIMGTKTRYPLQPNRRGLYGTAGIDTNSFGGGEYNWLMQIEIEDECLKPENIITFFNVAKSSRFLKWFKALPQEKRSGFKSSSEFDSTCFLQGVEQVPYTGNFANARCTEIMNNYVENSNVKIVQDHAILKAFYIRDRSCIKAIKGTPEELLEIALKNDLLWVASCNSAFGGAANFATVLAEALKIYPKELPFQTADQLIERAAASGNPEPMKAYRRCLTAHKMDEFRESSSAPYFDYNKVCKEVPTK